MKNILGNHALRYPLWEINDLYKLIHQAAMGSEHAITDETHVRRYLTMELASMGEGPAEPLLDPLSADGHILRIHLRPYVAANFDPEILLQAFIRTGKVFSQSVERLLEYARTAVQLANDSQLPFQPDNMETFLAKMQDAGFPAIHHSRTFEETYRPAYRVVLRALIPSEILALTNQME